MALILFSFWSDAILLIVFGFLFFYFWTQRRYSYWKNKGVEGLEPHFFIGNMDGVLSAKKTIGERFQEIYDQTKHLPHCGAFMMLRPCWVVNDVELIKRILIKDFAHFVDHGHGFNYKVEPLGEHLINLRGDRWKRLRTKMTPTFTTSRMRQMFGVLEACSRVMMQYMETNHESVVDVKELLGKLMTDIIGSCAFGIECDSFKDPDAEFRTRGRMLANLPLHKALEQFILLFFLPELNPVVPFSILGKDTTQFFINTVRETIEYREKNNIQKNDFMQLLIKLMKHEELDEDDTVKPEKPIGENSKLTLNQVAAQAFIFFFAGFETSSTTGSFALYELAKNPDIQKNLSKEIDEALAKHDGNITYDSIGEMTYLTMVIEETLRKYPPLPMLFRICTKDYTIPDTNIVIEKDTPVMIPVYGLHRDEKHYPDPERFDPERFSPENKEARHHFAYLPFGEGPRICIGSRFGMMQTKLGIASLLSKYDISVCDRTPIPMVYDKKSLVLTSGPEVFLKMTKRNI